MRHILWLAVLIAAAGVSLAAKEAVGKKPVAAALKADPQRPQRGQKVSLRMTVTNRGGKEVTLYFRSGQKYDFVVSCGDREVWRWSRGKVFIQAITRLTLKPGESRTFEATWEQKDNEGKQVDTGTYSVIGIVTTRPVIVSDPLEVRIPSAATSTMPERSQARRG